MSSGWYMNDNSHSRALFLTHSHTFSHIHTSIECSLFSCCSFMGRSVIDLPMDKIASFIARPEAIFFYDKYIVVGY